MTTMTNHQSATSTKLLLIGDSGTGKTGSLASLAKAGYELRILDFDNGLDILGQALGSDKAALERVHFQTLTEKRKAVNGVLMIDGLPTVWPRAMGLLSNWIAEGENYGPLTSWDSNVCLVIDSLTFAAKAAYNFVEATCGLKDGRAIYFEAQKRVESLLGMLYSPSVKCNVIVLAHIAYMETDTGVKKGFPNSIGQALGPNIPTYFNVMLQVKTSGIGAALKRVISTVPSALVDVKTGTLPANLPAELPIETGLADFFKIIRGEKS